MTEFRRRNRNKSPKNNLINGLLTNRNPLAKTNKLISTYPGNGNGKRPRGRPPEYKPEYATMAYNLCKNHGATLKQLSQHFGHNWDGDIDVWRAEHPEFDAAIKDGVEEWCHENVEATLLQRALGYEYEEKTVETVRVKANVPDKGIVYLPAEKIKRTIKHVCPSDVAIIFYLKNRRSDRWKDVREFEGRFSKKEISLRLQAELKTEQLKQLGVEELEQLEFILSKIDAGDSTESVHGATGSG